MLETNIAWSNELWKRQNFTLWFANRIKWKTKSKNHLKTEFLSSLVFSERTASGRAIPPIIEHSSRQGYKLESNPMWNGTEMRTIRGHRAYAYGWLLLNIELPDVDNMWTFRKGIEGLEFFREARRLQSKFKSRTEKFSENKQANHVATVTR